MKFGKGKGKNVLFVLVGVALLLLAVYFVFSKKIYEGAETKQKAAGVTPTLEQCRPVFAPFYKEEEIRKTTNKLTTDLAELVSLYPKKFTGSNQREVNQHGERNNNVGYSITGLLELIDAYRKMNITSEKKKMFDGYYKRLSLVQNLARDPKSEAQKASSYFNILAEEINKSLPTSNG